MGLWGQNVARFLLFDYRSGISDLYTLTFHDCIHFELTVTHTHIYTFLDALPLHLSYNPLSILYSLTLLHSLYSLLLRTATSYIPLTYAFVNRYRSFRFLWGGELGLNIFEFRWKSLYMTHSPVRHTSSWGQEGLYVHPGIQTCSGKKNGGSHLPTKSCNMKHSHYGKMLCVTQKN